MLKKEGVCVSHQCIYNLIHADASGELARHTRHKLKYRRRPKHKPFPIADRASIHSRPEQADGKRFGDFEMDLIVDSHNHAILTIVERSTNMLFITKLPHGKKSEPLAKAVRRLLLPYKKHIKTITTDNGPEFAAHKLITKFLGAVVYFADPYASWQKGAIENTNSSDSIFQSTLISMRLPIKRLQVYRRKSTVDPDKNLSLKHQKQSSSNE